MNALAALVILSVAAEVTLAKQIPCQHSITCPCGSTSKNVTVCIPGERKDDPCITWSKCKACQEGLDRCLECPEGLEGPLCTTATRRETLHRQKRQILSQPYQDRNSRPPSRPSQQGSNRVDTYPVRPVQGGGNRQNLADICPDLEKPKSGGVFCSTRNQQRTCVGTCLPLHSFEGLGSQNEITLICTDGQYTPLREFPPCKSGDYCDLEVQDTGSFNCTTSMTGTNCDVFCDDRYIGRYFCYPGRDWEPRLPHCIRPKDVEETQTCRCQYGGTCDRYGNCVCPAGRTGMICESIVREKQTCGDPGFVSNGFRRNRDNSVSSFREVFYEGETVVYGCDSEEYVLQGSSTLTCNSSSRWSGPLPKCVRTTTTDSCSLLTAPKSASVTCSSSGIERICVGTCQPGYSFEGRGSENEIILTSTDRNFNPLREFPPCKCFCPVLKAPMSGTSTCSSSGRQRICVGRCRPGYSFEGRGPEHEITLTCAGGHFSPLRDFPPCKFVGEKQTCRDPGFISNGFRRHRDQSESRFRLQFDEGETVVYVCKSEVYTLQGSSILTCKSDGTWSQPLPKCVIITASPIRNPIFCPDPKVDPNGSRNPRLPPSSRGFAQGNPIVYSCNQGYDLDGEKNVFCLPSGEWSSETPRCIVRPREPDVPLATCPNPGNIRNVQVQYINGGKVLQTVLNDAEFPQGGRLEYSCDNGYILEGSDIRICQPNGEWSGEPPFCTRDVEETQTCRCQYGGRCDRYGNCVCPVGRTGRICETIVREKHCSDPGFISNGFRRNSDQTDSKLSQLFHEGETVVYGCDSEEYVLEGSSTLTCNSNGRWSTTQPKCVRTTTKVVREKHCSDPGFIRNGFRRNSHQGDSELSQLFHEGDTVVYGCDSAEYVLQGSSTLTCNSDGRWSPPVPKCVRTTTTDCGRSIIGTTQRTTSDKKTVAGEWPWVVGIAIKENNHMRLICAGALLNTRTVITAAHCLVKHREFTLYFGIYYRNSSLHDDQVLRRTKLRMIFNPNFNDDTLQPDIALITFTPRITFSDRIQPICLPTEGSTHKNIVAENRGYVTGWGYAERRLESPELMMAHIPVVMNNKCRESFRINYPNMEIELTQNMFCAGFPDARQSPCISYSGSPMVFNDTNRYTLEGLISFAAGGYCDNPGTYTIFTKVNPFLTWINGNI